MSRIYLKYGILLLTIGAACNSSKKLYEFPDAMLPHVRVENETRCVRGKILYDMNCARCHSTFAGRKEIIPDFAQDQLTGYAIRNSNAQHETNMPDTLVTEEELALISTFLTYKKKNKKSHPIVNGSSGKK